MKVGTLVSSYKWGKGIVTEILTYKPRKPIRVCWLDPRKGQWWTNFPHHKVTTSVVWQNSVTIISEGE
jgi:hypothetical protein